MRDFIFAFEPEIIKAKSVGKDSKEFAFWAYASTWDVDSDECQITREALEGAKDDLLTYNTVLFNHNTDRPIGRVVETKIDNKGLLVKVVISNTEKEIIDKITDTTLSKMSIRGRAMEWQMTDPTEDGKQILQITVIKLYEVSVVSVPANKEAKTISSSFSKSMILSNGLETDDDVEKSLLTDMQLLSGRLTGIDKEVVDKVLDFFKNKQNTNMKEKQYDFSETSEICPIFQLNLQDPSVSEVDEEKHLFRKQILKKGKWYHYSADGGVLDITEKMIDNLIENFKKGFLDSVPVPLTHTNDPSMNTGMVKELIKTEEGLDAVLEIKDETVFEKIKKGLITAISASFDPNYQIKKTKEYVGPTLLHTALVSEPYIKGMGKFVALSDEYGDREIIMLEDTKFDIKTSLKQVFDVLTKIQKQLEEDEKKETVPETPETPVEIPSEDVTKDKDIDTVDVKPEVKESDETVPATKVDFADTEKIYTEYLMKGKMVPAQKDAFIALCEHLKTIQLSDNTIDTKSLLDAFMQSQPKIVNFAEDGTIEDPSEQKPVVPTDNEIPADVKDFYVNKMHLSEESAKEAWQVVKETHQKNSQKSTIFD